MRSATLTNLQGRGRDHALKLGPARIAWLQISHQKLRLLAAVLGVAFAVVLIFVQLGFRQALYDSSVRWHGAGL